jgi:muramoyltetrapeptide carboxypeptidase
MKSFFVSLFLVGAAAQAGVGTACTAYGVSGTCQVGHQCGGNWFSSVAGAVQGCGPFAANVRCCVPACAGDNGLPGICADTCDSRLPAQYSASGTGGCAGVCCTPSNLAGEVAAARALQSRVVLPKRVKAGDTVMLVAPSSAIDFSMSSLQSLAQSVLVNSLGLKVVYGQFVYESNDSGRVAGTDAQRAADVMKGFSDKSVAAIIAIGGGWGCARIVDLLDFAVIRQNPKPFMGYSDVTGCIAAIAWRAGITALVGPLMSSDWTNGNGNFARRALFGSIPYALTSFSGQAPKTVVAGRATGRLVGGNLSVLSAMIGARVPLFPATDERLILIIEDVGEEMYRVDACSRQWSSTACSRASTASSLAPASTATRSARSRPSCAAPWSSSASRPSTASALATTASSSWCRSARRRSSTPTASSCFWCARRRRSRRRRSRPTWRAPSARRRRPPPRARRASRAARRARRARSARRCRAR